MSKLQLFFTGLAVILVIGWAFIYRDAIFTRPPAEGGTPAQSITASFLCADSKSVIATFSSEGVALTLSDGRTIALPHAMSADGARFANADESFVFWNRGNTAFITEGVNGPQTYSGCTVASAAPAGWVAYLDSATGFTLSHPDGYAVNASYQDQSAGPGKEIKGVSFTIPKSMAAGTNLASDTLLAVEMIPNANECSGSLFLPDAPKSEAVTDNGTTYSVATSSGAGAGNFYEETVFAIPGTSPCVGIHYFIHSSNIGNYTPGAVKEFDRAALIKEFDQIRQTLVLAH